MSFVAPNKMFDLIFSQKHLYLLAQHDSSLDMCWYGYIYSSTVITLSFHSGNQPIHQFTQCSSNLLYYFRFQREILYFFCKLCYVIVVGIWPIFAKLLIFPATYLYFIYYYIYVYVFFLVAWILMNRVCRCMFRTNIGLGSEHVYHHVYRLHQMNVSKIRPTLG